MGFWDSFGDAASQVGGFFKGAGETLWETGKGVVDLGVGVVSTSYDLSPFAWAVEGASRAYEGWTGDAVDLPGWMPSMDRGANRLAAAADVVTTIAQDPGLLVDAVVAPIVDDWQQGNYGEAIGRGATELVLAVVGTKGLDKAAKGGRVAGVADDLADIGRVAGRSDDLADGGRVLGRSEDVTDLAPGLSRTQIDEIRALPKGQRPDPSDYLSPQYIERHLAQFDDGATRFMVRENLDKYGIGQRDGTSFVMPRAEADRLLASSGGDLRKLEEALGLPENFLEGRELVRVDVPQPRELGLRVPSGNEAGASDLWIPGGQLPNGNLEAVIDAAGVPPSRYSTSPVP